MAHLVSWKSAPEFLNISFLFVFGEEKMFVMIQQLATVRNKA